MKTVEKYLNVNFEPREGKRNIDMIVIHSTGSDNLNGTIDWFNNPNSKVSAHFVIDKDGTVYKLVKINDVAWHARGCNSRSVGIEIVQSVTVPATINQRIALAELVINLLKSIKTIRYLQGHFELTKGKTDPYEPQIVYDLRRYFKLRNINDELKATV